MQRKAASSAEGRFREASQGGTNRGEGPEMRHKTLPLVPVVGRV
jgi:hypothetical protein